MARSIMIQGTMSNVGKSLICAALCRIFRQDGYTPAPFKSQNMALNSFITRDGCEIGRAQAMQAEAAGMEPSVLMNPILLKPTTERGSQVIVEGMVLGNMQAAEYFRHKKSLVPVIRNAYSKLSELADIIVIEGAGSPAEMNLKADDIVNMGMAEIADAPVLLVGDIDRGGVFAQLIGTVSLLEESERRRIRGLIVNKFRGDRSLFEDGVDILQQKTGIGVLGVVPYINCDIDDEDSLSDTLERKSEGRINIAVIKLPKISNYTDIEPLRQYRGVAVRYIERVSELGEPDMIVIPGSKSTIADMKWLRESGFETVIRQMVSQGTLLFGICGGYQMLGRTISDPLFSECGGGISGLGLLDMETVFRGEKCQRQSEGIVTAESGILSEANGASVRGYEIHMGETVSRERSFIRLADGSSAGSYRENIFGTYLHGIFDNAEVSSAVVKLLFSRKGIPFESTVSRRDYKESQYDLLADAVRNAVDMQKIYDILSL